MLEIERVIMFQSVQNFLQKEYFFQRNDYVFIKPFCYRMATEITFTNTCFFNFLVFYLEI